MTSTTSLPSWLVSVRRRKVLDIVHSHAMTDRDRNILLGVPTHRIFPEVIGGGQANFIAPWEHLSPFDRVLLYAYFNQKGHLEELTYAFDKFFPLEEPRPDNPIVVDLGRGPFTGVLGNDLQRRAR